MSAQTLAEALSINTTPNSQTSPYFAHILTPAPVPSVDKFNLWFPNYILYKRWGVHYFSLLLSVVPSSQTRLRDEGLVPFYKQIRNMSNMLNGIARQRGVTLPPFPDALEDWSEEAATDSEKLSTALEVGTDEITKQMIDYQVKVTRTKGEHHWGSLVALIAVAAEVYIKTLVTAEDSVKALGDEMLAKYRELGYEELAKYTRVMTEEMARVRNEAGETGWREEEAKELVAEHMKRSRAFWAIVVV